MPLPNRLLRTELRRKEIEDWMYGPGGKVLGASWSSSASGPSAGCSGPDERGLRPCGHRAEQKTRVLLNGFGKMAAVLHDLRTRCPASKPTSITPSSQASRCC